ncbi:MAG: UDP-glucose dehydrogenase family protein [Terriglobia bacterium]
MDRLETPRHHASPSIAVLGLGYVGLPTALGLAELGWRVTGADQDTRKVELMRRAEIPFYETGLQPLLAKHLASGRFAVTSDVAAAVRAANVIFVCVGTPQRESGAADLSQVEAATRIIAENLNGYKLIVEKSTVPAITARWIQETLDHSGPHSGNGLGAHEQGADFDVASNPEFLREGQALENFFHPDRIVIGAESERARTILEEIYRPFDCPIVFTTPTTAELIKHSANAFLAAKISFINMVADVCDALGADVKDVARGMGLDPRIGPDFLEAGIGFGGYCFPKDLRAFIHLAKAHGVECSILESVERVNQRRIEAFLRKVRGSVGVVQGKTVAALGVAFKPNTDDIREAPSLKVIEALLVEGASLRIYDPQAVPNARRLLPERAGRVAYCSSPYEAARGSAALVILTEWDEFRALDLGRLKEIMEAPVIVDGRNIFDPATVSGAGFEYRCMGREPVRKAGAEAFAAVEGASLRR